MTRIRLCTSFLTFLLLFAAGCASNDDAASATATATDNASTAIPDQSGIPPQQRLRVGPTAAPAAPPQEEIVGVTFGRGIASAGGLDVTFMHNVTRYKSGEATGEFKHSAITEAGMIDIEADVTCAELDSKINKAWIGGKVKRNGSTNPSYAAAVGTDVWFRILDLGATEKTALISLPVMQQKGIESSAAFCSKKPWSDEGLLRVGTGALAIFP